MKLQQLPDVEHRRAPGEPGRAIQLLIAVNAIMIGLMLIACSVESPRSATFVPPADGHAAVWERTLRLTGSTVGENSVTLLAPYLRGNRTRGGGSGRFHLMVQQLIPEGSRVAVGDTVAMFDRESMVQQIDDLKADRAQAEGDLRVLAAKLAADREARDQQVRVAKFAVETAALDLKTASVRSAIQADLFKLALDEARTRYKQLFSQKDDFQISQRAQLRITQLEFQRSESELGRAQANAERMLVPAPRAGLAVLRQTVRNGEYATIRAGDELRPGQPYLDIVAPGPMVVDAAVNQVDVTQLHVGAYAEVVPEAFPDIRMKARLTAIGSIAMSHGFRADFVREIPVRFKIIGADPRLLPSLTVSVDVALGPAEDVPLVSRVAGFSQSLDAIVPGNDGTGLWR
ncbi:MAG: hypothetical protein ABI759_19090 [Candidatus Solibacter sp.]